MNTLNRFSNLDEDYISVDDSMNSFKPNKKSTPFKTRVTVQDTCDVPITKEFNIADQLFPCLTKTRKKVVAPDCLLFSKILATKENLIEELTEDEPNNMRNDCFIAVFNKKTRRLQLPPPSPIQKTEEEVKLQLFTNDNFILNELNTLHIRRSKKYLLAWGEDDYIKTFLSKEDVDLCPFLKN